MLLKVLQWWGTANDWNPVPPTAFDPSRQRRFRGRHKCFNESLQESEIWLAPFRYHPFAHESPQLQLVIFVIYVMSVFFSDENRVLMNCYSGPKIQPDARLWREQHPHLRVPIWRHGPPAPRHADSYFSQSIITYTVTGFQSELLIKT